MESGSNLLVRYSGGGFIKCSISLFYLSVLIHTLNASAVKHYVSKADACSW